MEEKEKKKKTCRPTQKSRDCVVVVVVLVWDGFTKM